MRVIVLLAALAMTASVAGCSRNSAVSFEGVSYKSRTSAPRADRKDFVTTVRPVSRGSLSGALAAGRYESTRHCIQYYGVSDIAWAIGPDTPPTQLRVLGDTLTLQGRCVE